MTGRNLDSVRSHPNLPVSVPEMERQIAYLQAEFKILEEQVSRLIRQLVAKPAITGMIGCSERRVNAQLGRIERRLNKLELK